MFIKIKDTNHHFYREYNSPYEDFLITWENNRPIRTIDSCEADAYYHLDEQPIVDISTYARLSHYKVKDLLREACIACITNHGYFNKRLLYAYATSFFVIFSKGKAYPYKPSKNNFEKHYQDYILSQPDLSIYEGYRT
jgi:hypothetical protein